MEFDGTTVVIIGAHAGTGPVVARAFKSRRACGRGHFLEVRHCQLQAFPDAAFHAQPVVCFVYYRNRKMTPHIELVVGRAEPGQG